MTIKTTIILTNKILLERKGDNLVTNDSYIQERKL